MCEGKLKVLIDVTVKLKISIFPRKYSVQNEILSSSSIN